jgi:hypothetical protein
MKILIRSAVALLALGAIAVAGTTQVFGAGITGDTSRPDPFANYTAPTGPELTQEAAVKIASEEAARDGESNPGVSIGTGTLEAAMRTINHSFNLPEPTGSEGFQAMMQSSVYLVTMQGRFLLADARIRRGASLPTGEVLDLVIDAHTGAIEGRALPTPDQVAANEGIQLGRVAGPTYIKVTRLTGTVSGTVTKHGGPLSAAHHRNAAHVAVTAKHRGASVTTHTNSRGVYTLHLRPGKYTLSGPWAGCPAALVSVKAGGLVRRNIACSIR